MKMKALVGIMLAGRMMMALHLMALTGMCNKNRQLIPQAFRERTNGMPNSGVAGAKSGVAGTKSGVAGNFLRWAWSRQARNLWAWCGAGVLIHS